MTDANSTTNQTLHTGVNEVETSCPKCGHSFWHKLGEGLIIVGKELLPIALKVGEDVAISDLTKGRVNPEPGVIPGNPGLNAQVKK